MRRIARIIGFVLLGAVGLLALLYAIAYVDLAFIEKPAPYDQAKLEALLVEGRRIDEALRSAPREDFTAMIALAKDINRFREKDNLDFARMFPGYDERLTREQAQAIEAAYGATIRDFFTRFDALFADGLTIYCDFRDQENLSLSPEERDPLFVMDLWITFYSSRLAQLEAALGNTEQSVAIFERILDYYDVLLRTSLESTILLVQFEGFVLPAIVRVLPELSVPQMQRLNARLASMPDVRPFAIGAMVHFLLRFENDIEWSDYIATVRKNEVAKKLSPNHDESYISFWFWLVYQSRLMAPITNRASWFVEREKFAHLINYLTAMRENPEADLSYNNKMERGVSFLILHSMVFDEKIDALQQVVDRIIARKTVGDSAPIEGDLPAVFRSENEGRKEAPYERGLIHYVIFDDYACIEDTYRNYKCSLEGSKPAEP